MTDDQITIGEIDRRLNRMEAHWNSKLDAISTEIKDQQFVHKEVFSEVVRGFLDEQKAQWAAIQEINDRDGRRVGWIVTGILTPIVLIVILQLLQLK